VVTRAGSDLEHALTGRGIEDLPQALAAEERMGALDEEALAVGEGRGMRPQPERRANQKRQQEQYGKKDPGHNSDKSVMPIILLSQWLGRG
jgi:hypothetical protein